jgi:hypothetical protein
MKFRFIFFVALAMIYTAADAQLINITASKSGSLYLMGGYHRDWYSKSDIHLKGNYSNDANVPEAARGKEYEFIMLSADAVDKPEVSNIDEWDVNLPQFYYKLGYLFYNEDILGIELGFDQLNYKMKPDQVLRVQGVMFDSTTNYVDSVDRDMRVGDNFVSYEHSGLNYLMLSFVRGMHLWRTRTEMHSLQCLVKPGAGIAFPHTLISVYGQHMKQDYHVAGFVAALEASVRYVYAEQVFIETGAKASYVNLSNIKMVEGTTAHQTFTSLQWMVSIGYLFHL